MKLALGTVQFGLDYGVANANGRVSLEEARTIINRSHQLGIDTLDTAVAYGDSESVLGNLKVQSWKVITKLPTVPENCKNITRWVKEQVSESLNRLQLNRAYGLLLHRPNQLHESYGPDLFAALTSLKASGLVNKIGVSVYGVEELSELYDKYVFDLVQAPLNILDRSLIDSGWAERLQNDGVEVHTRSAFLQGLLLMPKGKRPIKFERWDDIWTEWDNWLRETGLTPLEACLRYATGLDCVDRVVVGVNTVDQLDEIMGALAGNLTSLPHFKKIEDNRLINPSTWNQL